MLPKCEWFAMCKNDASMAARGPIGNGAWEWLPICDRCAKILKVETFPIMVDGVTH